MNNNPPLDIFAKLSGILLPSERGSALYLLLLMIVGMLFEMLGVGVVVPVMTALMHPGMLTNYPGGAQIQAVLGEYDQMTVIVAVLAALVGLYAVKAVFLAFLAWRQADFTYGVLSSTSGRLFKSYLGRPYQFHLANNSAGLVRNAVTESQVFALYVISPAISLLAELLVLFGITMLLIYLEPIGSLFAILAVSVMAFALYWSSKKWSLRFGALRQHHEGLRIKTLQEGLLTIKEVILLGRAANFLARYDRHAEISASSAGRQTLIGQLPRLALEFVVVLGCAVVFAALSYKGRGIDAIIPMLVLFGVAAFRLMPSVNRILIAISSLQYGLPVLVLLHSELSAERPDQTERESALHLDGPIVEFEFRDVDFRYRPGGKEALSDINIRIGAGEMVAFIGPSGAGKSSLIDVFLGLLPPTSGAVLVNGHPIDVASPDWKARIGYVPQSIVLIDDSIRRNVAFGLDDTDIDESKVLEAIEAAQLQDFVAELAEGLDTEVGEHGVRLSGGQRQRIGLARALYGNPEILVLDEATSALDMATENEVMAAIRGMHGKKTILIIAHRLSTVRECDRIVRLEMGRVVQEGTPAALIEGDIAASNETWVTGSERS